MTPREIKKRAAEERELWERDRRFLLSEIKRWRTAADGWEQVARTLEFNVRDMVREFGPGGVMAERTRDRAVEALEICRFWEELDE